MSAIAIPGHGGDVRYAHSAATVGTSSGQVLAANTSRKYALFINDSDTAIYLAIGQAAALNTGIRLTANGGSFEMSLREGNTDTRAVNAISSAAGKNLLIAEAT